MIVPTERGNDQSTGSLIIKIPLMPVHKWLWGVEFLAVDHRVGQHVLHVLAGFVEGDAFNPDIEAQVIGASEPLPNAGGACVVGGGGEYPVTVELAVDLAQVGGTELDVLVRVQYLLRRGQGNAEFSRGFLGGDGHQLH